LLYLVCFFYIFTLTLILTGDLVKNKYIIPFILLLTAAVIGQDKGDDKILPYPIHQHKLDNGLNVVTIPYDSPGLASFYIVVRVGSRNEVEEGVTGFAHFFEHMMFRGTDKYPREKYNTVLKEVGAGANANTSLDRTIYHMTGNAEKLETMFEIEADRFMKLNYTEHDFKTEAGAVKGEYTKNYASPYQQIYETTLNTAFDKHTYKHTTMGFFDDIVDMPNQFDYSKKFFDRFYRPEYSTIIVVGDVKPENVNKLAEEYFGMWEKGNYDPAIPSEPDQKELRKTHLRDATIPPYLSLNFKGPAFSDKTIDMPALDILSTILFSQNSELFKRLVIEEQKARYISGGAEDSRDPFLISIDASLYKPEDLQYVKDAIIKAIDKIKTEGVDKKVLEDTKSNLKYGFAMRIVDPDVIANSVAHYVYLTGDPESLNRLYLMYGKVTTEDVVYVANKYFVPEHLTIATISPAAEEGVK
jgi:zinc protease